VPVDDGLSRAVTIEIATIEKVQHSQGGSNSMVESQISNLLVAGSIPVSRSILSQITH
jgi:hypothetical protein